MCEAHFTFAEGKYFIFNYTSYLLLLTSYLKKSESDHLSDSLFFFTHTTPFIASPTKNTKLPAVIIGSLTLLLMFIPTINTISPTIQNMHPATVSFFILIFLHAVPNSLHCGVYHIPLPFVNLPCRFSCIPCRNVYCYIFCKEGTLF